MGDYYKVIIKDETGKVVDTVESFGRTQDEAEEYALEEYEGSKGKYTAEAQLRTFKVMIKVEVIDVEAYTEDEAENKAYEEIEHKVAPYDVYTFGDVEETK